MQQELGFNSLQLMLKQMPLSAAALLPTILLTGDVTSGAPPNGGRDNVASAVSLPPVEDMHPSWAARVKQQAAIKVTGIIHATLCSKMQFFTGTFVHLSFFELFLCPVAGQS